MWKVLLVVVFLCWIAAGQITSAGPYVNPTFNDLVVIDNFVRVQSLVFEYSEYYNGDLPGDSRGSSRLDPPQTNIIGGERDMTITVIAGPENPISISNFGLIASAGLLQTASPASINDLPRAVGFIDYDGVDNSFSMFSTTGLNSKDITFGGYADRLHIGYLASDVEVDIEIRIYTQGSALSNYCLFPINIPANSSSSPLELFIPILSYDVVGSGCDILNVGAIRIIIPLQDAADVVIGLVSTYGLEPSASRSRTPSVSESASISESISESPSSSLTATPTRTTSPTISETASVSISSTATRTASPTSSETPSASLTATATRTDTPTSSVTPSSSVTPTATRTDTPSPSLTASPSVTPTPSRTSSETPSSTSSTSFSASPTLSPSLTPSRSESQSETQSTSLSASRSRSPSISPTQSISESPSPSVTVTVSTTGSPSVTPTSTRTPTISRSPSVTPSKTRSQTASISKSPNFSVTPSPSKTSTPTISVSRSVSKSASVSYSPSRSRSVSVTPSVGSVGATYTTICPFAYVAPNDGRSGPLSVQDAFDTAWLLASPFGGCSHLATYDTEAEFNAIVQSVRDAGGRSSIIGGRRYSQSSYQWATGELRGRNWIEPHYGSAPISSVCTQQTGFCMANMANSLPITNDDQIGMSVYLNDAGIVYLVPTSGAFCYTIENSFVPRIAAVPGNLPYRYIPTMDSYDGHQTAAINSRQFIGQVSEQQQTDWILDELRCGTFNVWLGYETSSDFNLRFGPGTKQGVILQNSGSTTCLPQYYCNFPTNAAVTASGTAVRMLANYPAATNGDWSLVARGSSGSALYQQETCTPPGSTTVNLCNPQPSDMWLVQLASQSAANTFKFNNPNAFNAGGPYTFTEGGTPYLVYFSCNCATDNRIDLTCLGSSPTNNPPRTCSVFKY